MCEDLLHQSSLFSGISPTERQNITDKLTAREYSPRALIFSEGDPGNSILIICQGEVEIIKAIGTQEERLLTVVGPGEYLGEMSMIGYDPSRSASARARSKVHLLEMSRDDFEVLLAQYPGLAMGIMEVIINRIRESNDASIREVKEKNRRLTLAYEELKEAQEKLVQKEKLEHELAMARQIQEGLLPGQMPSPPGWQIESIWHPAQVVSGDFYDFIPVTDDSLAIVIGDVTGKGMPAALLMATTRSILRALTTNLPDNKDLSPGILLGEANKILVEDTPAAMSVTCLFAAVDLPSGRIRLANAGHCLPFHRKLDNTTPIIAKGMPLGFFPESTYDETELLLSPGESLLFYSDGMIEARNETNELFGNERLLNLLRDLHNEEDLMGELVTNLKNFAGPGWEKDDDLTMVLLRRH